MEVIKDYRNFKCVLKHDMNKEIMIIEMWRKGKVCFVSSVRNVEIMLFNKLADQIDEQETIEMYKLNMTAI